MLIGIMDEKETCFGDNFLGGEGECDKMEARFVTGVVENPLPLLLVLPKEMRLIFLGGESSRVLLEREERALGDKGGTREEELLLLMFDGDAFIG